MMMRSLTSVERELAEAIINALPQPKADIVRADLARSQVEDTNGDGTLLVFSIEDYDRPEGTGQHAFPVEATLRDEDGTQLDVTLYADKNDRLFELEIIRWGEGSIIRPDLASLRTY
jgi:hypothetical protein